MYVIELSSTIPTVQFICKVRPQSLTISVWNFAVSASAISKVTPNVRFAHLRTKPRSILFLTFVRFWIKKRRKCDFQSKIPYDWKRSFERCLERWKMQNWLCQISNFEDMEKGGNVTLALLSSGGGGRDLGLETYHHWVQAIARVFDQTITTCQVECFFISDFFFISPTWGQVNLVTSPL